MASATPDLIYGYLLSRRASVLFSKCQSMLLGDRSTCARAACKAVLDSTLGETRTRDLQITRPTLYHKAIETETIQVYKL